jgi:hypothetical protein
MLSVFPDRAHHAVAAAVSVLHGSHCLVTGRASRHIRCSEATLQNELVVCCVTACRWTAAGGRPSPGH